MTFKGRKIFLDFVKWRSGICILWIMITKVMEEGKSLGVIFQKFPYFMGTESPLLSPEGSTIATSWYYQKLNIQRDFAVHSY